MAAAGPLNVLQMVPALESGGVERGTLELASHLVRQGHRSRVMSMGGRLVDQLETEGSEHLAWPIGRKSPLTLAAVPRLRRWLRHHPIDIVHARSRVPAWVAYLAWRGLEPGKRPGFVTTVHGLNSVSRYSEIMTRGERVIAVSQTVADHVRRHYPRADSSRIRLIPRGVDARQFPHGYRPPDDWMRRWRREYPELRERFVLTLPGRITRLKGHRDLFKVLGVLARESLPVFALIVGEPERRGGYAEALRREAEAQRLPVRFIGYRADMRDVYAASDVVLSLSTQPESFGRTVLEALSLGVPVVGYAHGGVAEILNGLFPSGAVPVGDWEAVAGRIRQLAHNPTRVAPSSAFELQRMLDDTLAVYRDLATARSRDPLGPTQPR